MCHSREQLRPQRWDPWQKNHKYATGGSGSGGSNMLDPG